MSEQHIPDLTPSEQRTEAINTLCRRAQDMRVSTVTERAVLAQQIRAALARLEVADAFYCVRQDERTVTSPDGPLVVRLMGA